MNEASCLRWSKRYVICCWLFMLIVALSGMLEAPSSMAQTSKGQAVVNPDLARAKVYLQVGDYRRAVEACQRNIDQNPSVEAYVYLAYVYQATDGYLGYLAKQEDYVKVEQLSLNLTAREVIDIIDPPNVMARMAQELIHEGLRQQFDITSAMANRLDRARTDELWLQQSAWRKAQPDSWWAGVPQDWQW